MLVCVLACVCMCVYANPQYTAGATGKIEEHVCTFVIEAKQERDGARERERERECVGGAAGREEDHFLALLLNKSVSIATIQPAAGERREGG